MPEPRLYRDDLDLLDDFRHSRQATIRLKPRCHPLAALRVIYDRSQGRLCLYCAVCDEVVYVIDVGLRPRAHDRRRAQDAVCEGG